MRRGTATVQKISLHPPKAAIGEPTTAKKNYRPSAYAGRTTDFQLQNRRSLDKLVSQCAREAHKKRSERRSCNDLAAIREIVCGLDRWLHRGGEDLHDNRTLSNERPEAPLFCDGLGERVVAADGATGELLQILRIRPALTAVPSFEFALRERAPGWELPHAYYARVRRIDRVGARPRLSIVSDHVEDARLSDMLRVAHERNLQLDINAALCLIRQLVAGGRAAARTRARSRTASSLRSGWS